MLRKPNEQEIIVCAGAAHECCRRYFAEVRNEKKPTWEKLSNDERSELLVEARGAIELKIIPSGLVEQLFHNVAISMFNALPPF